MSAASNDGPLFPASPATVASAYAAPVVTRVSHFVPLLDTRGGDAVVVTGQHFGPLNATDNQLSVVFARPHAPADLLRFVALQCRVSVAHTVRLGDVVF